MPELNELANANAELSKDVETLSKPENETELNKVLTDELNQQEGDKPADKTPEDQPSDQSSDKTPDENTGDNKTDDGKGDSTPSKDENKGDKPDKFKELLEDRNEARDSATEADIKLQAAEKRISDLEENINNIQSGKSGEGETSTDDDTPLTKSEVEKILAEKESAKQQDAVAEKTRQSEVEALKENKDFPKVDEFSDKILEMMGKKNINAKMAYYAMKGAGVIPSDDASVSSNANKLNTGDKTKASLNRDMKPNEMSDEALEKAAKEELSKTENIF